MNDGAFIHSKSAGENMRNPRVVQRLSLARCLFAALAVLGSRRRFLSAAGSYPRFHLTASSCNPPFSRGGVAVRSKNMVPTIAVDSQASLESWIKFDCNFAFPARFHSRSNKTHLR